MTAARRTLFALGTVLVCIVTTAVVLREPLTDRSEDVLQIDLADYLRERGENMDPDDAYRPPTDEERRTGARGLDILVEDPTAVEEAATVLEPLGFSVLRGTDTVSGRSFVMIDNETGTERAWGTVVIDPNGPPSSVIEVPHPHADRDTETLGAELFRENQGAILMMAGAHRRASDDAGDVAHRTDSLFHAFALDLMTRGLLQTQVHGFDASSDADTDSIVSPGAGEVGESALHMADSLEHEEFTTCRAWEEDCPLEGKQNVQGRAAAKIGVPFIHLELARPLRSDDAQRARVVDAMTEALPGRD